MRNPETANHNVGQLLAAAAAHLVLLTATPIQIGGENLFNLLRLIDPDRFSSRDAFERIRGANGLVTKALNAVRQGSPPSTSEASRLHWPRLPARNRLFQSDQVIKRVARDAAKDLTDTDERVRVARLLEERSLLSSVFSRTRKRDVMQNRVIRDPRIIRISLNASERAIYDSVTNALRRKAHGASTANTFALVARQRQLASSIPAAVMNWRENPDTAELLEEDLGFTLDPEEIGALSHEGLQEAAPSDVVSLEAIDTKYAAF